MERKKSVKELKGEVINWLTFINTVEGEKIIAEYKKPLEDILYQLVFACYNGCGLVKQPQSIKLEVSWYMNFPKSDYKEDVENILNNHFGISIEKLSTYLKKCRSTPIPKKVVMVRKNMFFLGAPSKGLLGTLPRHFNGTNYYD